MPAWKPQAGVAANAVSGVRSNSACPDLNAICLKWLKYSLTYPITRRIPALKLICDGTRDYIVRMFVGPQDYEGMLHKSGFDRYRLRAQLEAAGFEVTLLVSGYPKRPTPSLS